MLVVADHQEQGKPCTYRGSARSARIQSVESRPFHSGAAEFLGREDDVSVNITSRTDFGLTTTDFVDVSISTICTCEPLKYPPFLLALSSAQNSSMAMFVHSLSGRSDRPRDPLGPKLNMPVRIVQSGGRII